MILKLIKMAFGAKSLGLGNAVTGLAGAGGVIVYLLQQKGQTFCFSLLELAGLGIVASVLLEFNRRTKR
jgi:hypothetical protein